MAVAFNEVPAGGDMSPLFVGLPDNACPAAHWGYILEGAIRLKYVDGKEETVKAGEVFYWPAGHIPFVEKDLKIIDFTPEAEFNQLMAHLAKKMRNQNRNSYSLAPGWFRSRAFYEQLEICNLNKIRIFL